MKLPTQYEKGLRISLAGGADFVVEDRGPGEVAVEPREGSGAVRKYFSARKIADARTDIVDDSPWAFLAVQPPAAKPTISLPATAMPEWQRLHQSGELGALVERLSIEIATTEVERLPDVFRRELPALFSRYPNGSLWYVGVDPVIIKRLTGMRIAFQLEIAPDSPFGDSRAGITYFGAHQLTGGLNFVEAVQPVLLAFSPVVSGFAMNALPGAFVFLFGQFDDEQDLRTNARDKLATRFYPAVNAHPMSPGIKVPTDLLGIGEVEALLAWWMTRLNILYSHAGDPTRFATAAGDHDVTGQAAWFFTFERMLADFAALGAAVDSPGLLRMQGAFDALDKASSLLVGPGGKEVLAFRRLLHRGQAVPRVEQAFDCLPLQARSRFKRWARTAYDRLYADIREQTMPDRITADGCGVKVGWSGPTDLQVVPWDDYVGELIREARNASHGLLDMLTVTRKNRRPRRLLLATNQGDVPASLYEVARVICLALLADAAALCDRSW